MQSPSIRSAPSIAGLCALVALTAAAGGAQLLLWPHGNRYAPIALLDNTPFGTFTIPGLLLAFVVAGTAALGAVAARRRWRTAPELAILAGGALTLWIVAEAALMREVAALHVAYGLAGIAILALGARAAWRGRSLRARWVIVVTVAESIGYLAPALTGVLTARAGIEGGRQAAAIVAAGLVEGLALGIGQALVLPWPVRRARYALLTSLGAATVWASVMLAMRADSPAAWIAVAVIGTVAIGGAQWLELRHHTPHARRWIVWTAIAWAAALPASFAPGPLVDESTPLATHVALWSCGGVAMAYVMALVTWQGVRRTVRRARREPCGTDDRG